MKDFKTTIISERNNMVNFDFSELKDAIIFNEKEKNRKKSMSELAHITKLNAIKIEKISRGEVVEPSFEERLRKIYSLGSKIKPSIELSILTLNLYESYAISCLTFYLCKNRIEYFEIHSAFEKMGVFDSSWQKNIKSSLESIDDKLALLNNNLNKISSDFQRLADSHETMVESLNSGIKSLSSGLDGIQSSINANTIVNAITAYQSWNINNNTKSIN